MKGYREGKGRCRVFEGERMRGRGREKEKVLSYGI